MKEAAIKRHIIDASPRLGVLLKPMDSLAILMPRRSSVLEAVCKIVIGQMLSRGAANAIFVRAKKLAQSSGESSIGYLSAKQLLRCGLSKRKAKAIRLFAKRYKENRDYFESWRYMSVDDLFLEVNQHWGLSDWSASMLAIFHFGMEDVFPYEDGSMKRALAILKSRRVKIEPELFKPYRSYLALYLWELLDNGRLES